MAGPPQIFVRLMGPGMAGADKARAQGCELEGSWGPHRTPWHPVLDPLDPLRIGKAP